MSQQKRVINPIVVAGLTVGLGLCSMGSAIAEPAATGWSAPAPMGPYGGHFDFGIPAADEVVAEQAESTLQAEYAVYQQHGELPVMNAAYKREPVAATIAAYASPAFTQEELGLIDPAWSLDGEYEAVPAQELKGSIDPNDVWALGEIRAEKRAALTQSQPVEMASVATTAAPSLQPCTVEQKPAESLFTSAHTPFQEAVLDELEHAALDMDAVALEADQFSMQEEREAQRRSRAPAPLRYSTYMPDYALGVRRANAMDPLALTPQRRSPVQYFGFQQ